MNNFLFREVKWQRYVKQERNIVYYKTTLKENYDLLKFDLSRKKVTHNNLHKAYSCQLPIKKKRSHLFIATKTCFLVNTKVFINTTLV